MGKRDRSETIDFSALESEPRTQEFLDHLTRMASGETAVRIPISRDRNLLDAIGHGINMLAEELRYTSVSRDELRRIYDAVQDLLVVVDRNGILVQVNQTVLNLVGGTPDRWLGNPWNELFDAKELKLEGLLSQLASGQCLEDFRWSVHSEHGETIPLSVGIAPLGDEDDHSHIVIVARDLRTAFELQERKAEGVAERKRAADFQRARELAEQANLAKSTFLANVSHELRTPLTVILSCSELLGHDELSSDRRAKCIEHIQVEALNLRRLVDDLLDSSRIETGKLQILKQNVPLRPLLDEVFANHETKARAKGLSLLREDVEGLPETVFTDPLRFRQILDNLIGNATKFTHHGSIGVYTRQSSFDALQIEVHDTGIGIPSEKLDLLFLPFSQIDVSIARTFGGTGLGLALSRNLARLLGGDITLISSREGKGSSFLLTLPVAR